MRTALVLVVSAGCLVAARPADAQCTSNASTCSTCHTTQGVRPAFPAAQPWHADHAFADLCGACHGGDPLADEPLVAHAGLRDPLSDPARSCAGCHDDAAARVERYLASRPNTSSAEPVVPDEPVPPAPSANRANRILALVAGALAVALVVALRRPKALPPLWDWAREKTWSPYHAGILLGLVVAITEVGLGRPLAASGAFDKLAAYPGAALFPDSPYYAHVLSPGITWQVWLIVGVLLGAFTSSKLAGEVRVRWLPDTQWEPRFGGSRGLRLALAFTGAVLVQVGAGIAGGCTSGLAISGGAVLAPAAFLFMAGMFAGGIPTAWLWYRGRGGTP